MAENEAKKSTKTMTVACKLPHGMICRLARKVTKTEQVMGGGSREVAMYEDSGLSFTINGWAHPQNAAPRAQIVGGFALTENVPAEHWETWLSQNREHDAVRNGLIFAYPSASDAQAAAKDAEQRRSGLERLDPKKLPGKLEKATA